jgi:hypothetical protein
LTEVPARHVILGVLAAAVLVAAVYLFLEVRATPSAIANTASPQPTHVVAADEHHDAPQTTPSAPDHGPAHLGTTATTTTSAAPTLAGSDSDEVDLSGLDRPNVKLEAYMDQANKAYDKSDWEEAKMIAGKVLAKQPTNVRMLRIMVSASCIDGDSITAQKYYGQLPKFDRDQMKSRCDRYGVSFTESP